jgi:recombinational DNA repair protein RecT
MREITFRSAIVSHGQDVLRGLVPAADLRDAAARVGQAFEAARSAARDPKAYDLVLSSEAGIASIRRAIVQSALSGIYPGGASPLAWIIPQRTRKDAPWEIRYSLSHRGAALLAAEEGWVLIPVAVHVEDTYAVEYGEIVEHVSCGQEPTQETLAGVYLTLRRGTLVLRPWLSAQAIESRWKRSQAPDSPAWKNDYVAMAQKTAIHYAVARGILPLRSAVARDTMGDEVEESPASARVAAPRRITETPEEAPVVQRETVTAPTSDTAD